MSLHYPEQQLGELIEVKRRRAEAEWESGVKEKSSRHSKPISGQFWDLTGINLNASFMSMLHMSA